MWAGAPDSRAGGVCQGSVPLPCPAPLGPAATSPTPTGLRGHTSVPDSLGRGSGGSEAREGEGRQPAPASRVGSGEQRPRDQAGGAGLGRRGRLRRGSGAARPADVPRSGPAVGGLTKEQQIPLRGPATGLVNSVALGRDYRSQAVAEAPEDVDCKAPPQ